MSATAADISAGTRRAVVREWSDAAIQSRYPDARDGRESPAEGFFDDRADAETVIDARGALIGTERGNFAVDVLEPIFIDPANPPTITLTDAEHDVDGDHLTARYELDLEDMSTRWGLFG